MARTLLGLPGTTRRKVGTTSNHHAPYDLGYTRATMAETESGKGESRSGSQKSGHSSDCGLQPARMKQELLVIADQHAAVNTFPGLVHTARHTMGVGSTRRQRANREGASDEGEINDWGEVVTR